MAEGKKSFIAYSDWYGTFKALPDEVAGQLIKYIFSYVNDESPEEHENYVVNALFEQVKATLKRDLHKWDKQRKQRSEAGKRSAELRATKSNERSTSVNETVLKATVSVNDSVSVNVNDINTTYSEIDFLNDWNKIRYEILNKPSNQNRIGRYSSKADFKELQKIYKAEDFKQAIEALMRQQQMPNGNESMRTDPKHLLENFERYVAAYADKNTKLYGEKKKVDRL